MATSSLGTLTLDVVAKIGGYTQGLDKAEKEAKKRAAAIENAFDKAAVGVGIAFGAIATAAVGAFAAISKGIDEAAKFQDLSDYTGAAAEDIASFAVAAETAGVSIEDVAGAMNKLTKNLEDAKKPGNETAQALKNLGINLDDFLKQDPATRFESLSKAFNSFADSDAKVSNSMALFGKAGAEQLKVFKALEDQGGRTNILTAEQIRLADEYGDKQAEATAKLKLYVAALSTEAIPALTATTNAVKDLIAELITGSKEQSSFALNLTILDWAEKVAVAIGTVIEAIQGLAKAIPTIGSSFKVVAADIQVAESLNPITALRNMATGKGGLQEALDNRNKVLEESNKKYQDLWNYNGTQVTETIKKNFANQRSVITNMQDPEIQRLLNRSNAGKGTLPTLTGITGGKGAGSTDDPTKKLLDNQLKEQERYVSQEKDLLAQRNKYLDQYNSQGLISIDDYYKTKQAILDEATKNQVAAYDAEIKALQDYQAKAPKATDRADAQGKINDLLEKQAKLERDAGAASIDAQIQRTQATKAYNNQLQELNARLLELQGNTAKASEIRFNLSNEQLRNKLLAEGNTAALAQLDTIQKLTVAQAGLNEQQQKYADVQAQLQIQEQRIQLDVQTGAKGELTALKALGEARQKSYDQLKGIYEQYQKIADASGDPKMIQQAQQLKLQLDQLGASLDPLADKFNEMFANKFGDAFSSIIDGTKSVKAALKDMVNSFISDLAKMAAQDVFKSFVSGGGSATGGTGFDFGSLLSSFFGGGRANGGPVMPNMMYRVNENGPELFEAANGNQYLMTGNSSGKVISNGAGFSQQNTFVVQGNIDRRTQTQIAGQVRQQTNTAAQRFG